MNRARLVATGIALVAAATIGAVYLVGRSDGAGTQPGGPLACANCAGDATSASVGRDKPASLGSIYLTNRGKEPAVLEDVRLLNAEQGIELAGALIVVPVGEPLIGFARGFPPAEPGGPTRPFRGYALAPARGSKGTVQLLLGVKVTADGHFSFRHVAIDYRVGDRRYRTVVRSSLQLCAPLDFEAECPLPSF